MSKSSRAPIIEFLGQDAGVGGPFAILALPHAIISDEQIVLAMKRRLYQIDLHPQRSTPDADEVRLAIHAAASQLRDPALREQLAMRWPQGKSVSLPSAWKPTEITTKVSDKFLKSAKLLIAASGGWNSTARKRLAHLARLNRVTALEVVRAIHPSGSVHESSKYKSEPTHNRSQLPISTSSQPVDRVHLIDAPTRGFDSWTMSYGVLFVLGALIVTSISVFPPQRDIPIGQQLPVSDTLSKSTPAQRLSTQNDKGGTVTRSAAEIQHYTAIAYELDQLVSRSQSDPINALERFAEIYHVFVDGWMQFPAPALKRASLHITEFVRTIDESPVDNNVLISILACKGDAQSPTQIMIKSGVLDVVLSEPRLSHDLQKQLEMLRKQCTGYNASPNGQINLALSLVAGLMGVDSRTDDPAWWSQWIAGVKAATSEDQEQRTKLALSAMSARLRGQSIPDQHWKQIAIELVSMVQWRQDSESRYWLISQFDDESVSTARLAALTDAVATHSGDQGVNATMVLNPSDTPVQRQQLREEYKAAWQPKGDTSQPDSTTGKLTSEMRFLIATTPKGLSQDQALSEAVKLARLNALAMQFVQSDQSTPIDLTHIAANPVSPSPTFNNARFGSTQRDNDWAQSAMNAEDAQQLATIISEILAGEEIGINSAHALVYVALNNSDSEMRSLAEDQVLRYMDQPSILIAVDRAIGSNRISSRLEKLVSQMMTGSLPSRTDPDWFNIVHQSILSRLAQSAAADFDSSLAFLQSEFAESYSKRLNAHTQLDNHDENALGSIKAHYRQLLFETKTRDGMVQTQLEEIESRLAIRIARSQSPMHAFLGYQRAICSLLAWRSEQDIAGAVPQIRLIHDELELRLSVSTNIVDQVTQAERSICELLLLEIQRGHR